MAQTHPLELIFLVASTAGLILNIRALWETSRRRAMLIESGHNGIRRLMAFSDVMEEWLRVTAQLMMFICAMLLVFIDRIPPRAGTGGLLALGLFSGVSVILSVKSVVVRWIRTRMRDLDVQRGRRSTDGH